jgi:hypothetical protein
MILIGDSRCKDCKTDALVSNLRTRFFSKLEVRELDYARSTEAKQLLQTLKLDRLPVLLFEKAVEGHERYPTISRWMEDKGRYRQLRVPATFDPTAEICDNGIDDTGNGLVDCADPTCKLTLACRPERKRQLDLFVMSQCPYGAQALLSMKEVLGHFKGQRIAFNVHYIADSAAGGTFSSLHGQPEVEEDIRLVPEQGPPLRGVEGVREGRHQGAGDRELREGQAGERAPRQEPPARQGPEHLRQPHLAGQQPFPVQRPHRRGDQDQPVRAQQAQRLRHHPQQLDGGHARRFLPVGAGLGWSTDRSEWRRIPGRWIG